MRNLIVCYSYSGKTNAVAEILAQELNGTALRVEDVEMPSKFKAYISGAFAARKGKAWPIKQVALDISSYNRIFVGAPIWWGKAAPEINAFIDQTDFKGKVAVVFVTMGGSDPDEALKALSERIEAKGGKIESSFAIKTGGLNKEQIAVKAKEAAAKYK